MFTKTEEEISAEKQVEQCGCSMCQLYLRHIEDKNARRMFPAAVAVVVPVFFSIMFLLICGIKSCMK